MVSPTIEKGGGQRMLFGERGMVNLRGSELVRPGPILGNAGEKVLFRVSAQEFILMDKGCDSDAGDRQGIFDADDLGGEADANSFGQGHMRREREGHFDAGAFG